MKKEQILKTQFIVQFIDWWKLRNINQLHYSCARFLVLLQYFRDTMQHDRKYRNA
jgi:hypothetical protein